MSARDELAELISDALGAITGIFDTTDQEDQEIADEILAAGYTKPRTITTAEELDALPDDSVVLDDMDGPLTKVGDWWHFPSGELETWNVILPATVLYEPTA